MIYLFIAILIQAVLLIWHSWQIYQHSIKILNVELLANRTYSRIEDLYFHAERQRGREESQRVWMRHVNETLDMHRATMHQLMRKEES